MQLIHRNRTYYTPVMHQWTLDSTVNVIAAQQTLVLNTTSGTALIYHLWNEQHEPY